MAIAYEDSVINLLRKMRHPSEVDMRFRLTVTRLMVFVSAAGLCLAAYRLHVSLGSLAFGVLNLALLRTFGKLDRAGGAPVRLSTAIGIFVRSMAVAAAIIGVSFLTLAGVYFTAYDSDRWFFLWLGFGIIGLGLVRMADALFRLWEVGTHGDRRIVKEKILLSLRTPVIVGLVLLALTVILFPVQTHASVDPLYIKQASLSLIVALPVARRMRRWLW